MGIERSGPMVRAGTPVDEGLGGGVAAVGRAGLMAGQGWSGR
jgi:hypothetical protein